MFDVKRTEKVIKGFANHHRIRILTSLEKDVGLSLFDISEKLNINFRTASEHTRKLVIAGLISKRYKGNFVQHAITPRGKQVLKFCRSLK